MGTILSILESKWGFLILIVFPSLLAFLYELWEFIANIKAAKEVHLSEKERAVTKQQLKEFMEEIDDCLAKLIH